MRSVTVIATIQRQWRALGAVLFVGALVAVGLTLKFLDDAPSVQYNSITKAAHAGTADSETTGHPNSEATPLVVVTVNPADAAWGKTVDPAALLGSYYRAKGPATVLQRVWLRADEANLDTAALIVLASYSQPDDPRLTETAVAAIATQPSGSLFVASSVGLFSDYRSFEAVPKGDVTGSLTSFTPVANGVEVHYTGSSRALVGIAELSGSLTWTGSHLAGTMTDSTRKCANADFADTSGVEVLAGSGGASREVYVNFPSATHVCSAPSGPVILTARDSTGKILGTWTSGDQGQPFGAWNSSKQNHVVLGSDAQCPVDAQVFTYTLTTPWGGEYTTPIRCEFDLVGSVVPGPA